MSTTAFAELEREAIMRADQIETSRAEREANGPTALELAQQRITALESQRDDMYLEMAGVVRDLQEYFHAATGMHDVYRGIESMEIQRTAMLDALRVTEGNVASLAATTPAVYGVWLEVVRDAIATGEAKS